MIRGWIIFSSLVLSVLFRLFHKYGKNLFPDWSDMSFLFSDKLLNRESWVYFLMEHIIAVLISGCLLIKDSTPRSLLWLYFAILLIDGLHFVLFFRDEGIGFNLAKVIIYGVPLTWKQLKQLKKQE